MIYKNIRFWFSEPFYLCGGKRFRNGPDGPERACKKRHLRKMNRPASVAIAFFYRNVPAVSEPFATTQKVPQTCGFT